MKKNLIKLLSIASLALCANFASADFYVGGGLYATTFDISDGDFDEDDDTTIGVFVGWKPPIIPMVSFELGYYDLGGYESKTFDSSYDASAITAAGVLTLPIPIVTVYGKLGVAKTDFDGKILGQKFSEGSTDPYYAIGAAFTLLPIVDFFLEFQRFDLGEEKISGEDVTIDMIGLGVKAGF